MIRAAVLGVLAMLALGLAARPADACSIVSTTSVALGTYDVYATAPLDSSGSITYRCTLSLAITIEVSTGSSGTYAPRRLRSSTSALAYNLFTTAARTVVWGNGATGTGRYGPVLGLLSNTTIPIYARIPARQDVPGGTYSDTVIVTLNY